MFSRQRSRSVVERLATILFAIAINLSGALPAAAEDGEPSEFGRQGLALAERLCASCHAIGKTGASPQPPAPAFRELGDRVELDDFAHRLRQGLTSGHPDMPTFRFTREDARALTAYLRSIQVR
jgi:cytochrome c